MRRPVVSPVSGWSGLSGPVAQSHAVLVKCAVSVLILAVLSSPKQKLPSVMAALVFTLSGPIGQFAQLSAQAEFLDAINITTAVPSQLLKRELVEPIVGHFGLLGQLARLHAQVSVLAARLTSAELTP